jgi:prepilin-type N-terminal cleavage/methylation domain-containing protein
MIGRKVAKGFTLIEVITTVAMALILYGILVTFLTTGIKTYKINEHTVELQDNISRAIREFEYSTRAASELVSLNSSNLVFYRYYDLEDEAPTKVHYYISQDNEFIVSKIKPVVVESDISWPEEMAETTLLIDGVQNSESVFAYYDQNNTQITTIIDNTEGGDITNQALLLEVRMINLSITLNDDSNQRSRVVEGSTRVNLRNLKTNI